MEEEIKYALFLTNLVLLANGCTGQHSGPTSRSEGVVQGQHVEAGVSSNGFSVNLAFSEKAKTTLVGSKETVVVAGFVTGFPKPGAPEQYVGETGEIELGQVRAEVPPGNNVTFSAIQIRRDSLEQIDSQGPQLLINVYSGRKSSRNNLLDCGIYQGSLKAVQGRSIPISCKLIGE